MAVNVGIPAGCEVEETIVLFNGFPLLSLMINVIVPVLTVGVGVGVGVGVVVGAGAGVTVTCVVP